MIRDNFKCVQRASVLIKKKKIPMLLLKLDISKAFDTLSWPFLLDLLRARGFGPRWCGWIEALLATASSKILLNGRPGPAIKTPPMLFILAMDVLHMLVTKACADGVLQPMETQGVRFQCSLYADDVILFIRPTVQEAIAVKEILTIFGDASGLRTNLNKCSITPIFGGQEALDDIVQILGCQVQQFPLRYLGLPMTTSKIPKAEFQALVESVTRKMPTCHGSLMARSGRLIWIKSVLRAIPIYSMMAENLRAWARNEIDNVCRKFLWAGKDASVRGKCMVAWEACCRPTEQPQAHRHRASNKMAMASKN
jgi:hypothetical protein